MPPTFVFAWFFVAAALPAVAWVINFQSRSLRFTPLKISFFSSAITYLLLLVLVFGYEFYLDAKLDTFDLNYDGFFSNEEVTEEYAAVSEAVVQDTGRTFAPITGAVATSIYFLVVLLFSFVLAKAFRFKVNAT